MDLLSEDGVMFISIDDNEVHNLRTLANEIFGEEKFLGTLKRRAARKTAHLSKGMTDICDYVLTYCKRNVISLYSGQIAEYTYPVFNPGNRISERIIRSGTEARIQDGVYSTGLHSARTIEFTLLDPLEITNGQVVNDCRVRGPFRINQDILDKTLFVTRNMSLRRNLLPEEKQKFKTLNDLIDDKSFYNENGTEELNNLFQCKGVFDHPKPSSFIEYLIKSQEFELTKKDYFVLDFFSGSSTTAHAVLNMNKDGESRKFICVQLPEKCKVNSVALSAGYENIAEIGKERIRRVAARIKQDFLGHVGDLGFKVFKLDTSNIRPWNPTVNDLEESLLNQEDHLVEGRSEEDILYELLLKRGVELTVPIENRQIAGKTVYSVGSGVLFACLDESIEKGDTEALGQGIIDWHEDLGRASDTHIVFRDSAFADDIAKTNMTAILEQNGIAQVRSL